MNLLPPLRLAPLLPLGWIVLVTLALLALLAWGCVTLRRRQVPLRWIVGLGVLRALGVLVFTTCLLGPVLEHTRTRQMRPQLLVLADESRSMARDGLLSTLAQPVRDGELGAHLREHYDVHWYGFGASARPLPAAEVQQLVADESQTQLAQALESALRHHAAVVPGAAEGASVPPRVLLLSDGLDLSRRDGSTAARQQQAIVDVLLPPASAGADHEQLELRHVQAPTRVMLGTEARFALTLTRQGQTPRQTSVVLLEDQQEVRRHPVTFEAGQTEARILLSYRPTATGLRQYSIAAPDLPPYTVAVQVSEASHDVLLLEDRWRWGFRYLRRVLEDDPAYHLTAMLARGGQSYVHFGEPTRRVNLAGYPQSAQEVEWFDLIVLGDVDLSRWPSELARGIAAAVSERGAGLIVIAGPRLGELAQHPVLGPLLPVYADASAGEPIPGPIRLRVTDDPAAAALLSASPETLTALRSEQLPPVNDLYPVQRKRPAAAVLLEAAAHASAAGPLIAMAQQPVGRGRVLLLATDSLWKWQTEGPLDEQGQTLHQRFWQQALRALTPVQSAAGAATLWVSTPQSRVQVGDAVDVSVQLQTTTAGVEVQAKVVDPAGQSHPLALTPRPGQPGQYGSTWRVALAGPQRIEALATRGNQPLAAGVAAVQGIAAPTEDDPLPPDRARLLALAQATGGQVIDPADRSTWPGQDVPREVTVTVRSTIDLWRNFTLLLLLAALLGTDWLLRMMRGYV